MRLRALFDVARTALGAERGALLRSDVGVRRRLWLYRHGFLSSRDAVWSLSPATVDDHLSDLQVRATGRIDEPHADALANKLLFRLVLGPEHRDLLPALRGRVRDGRFLACPFTDGLDSPAALRAALDDGAVVAKPVAGDKGTDVHLLERRDDQLLVDGRPASPAALERTLASAREFLLEERVEQAAYAAAVYPDATNSARLLTMVDPDTGEPFVAGAVHRFGTDASGGVDNWSRGAVSARIDLESGELGGAVAAPESDVPAGERLTAHPDTGERIAGVTVPGWSAVRDRVLSLAGAFGSLWPYVGWDVVVTDADGSVAVLEGNRKSTDADLQAHYPLLATDRARRFYEHHGVL